MVPQAAIDAAHTAAVMVRAHGPDPKGRKMRRHAFFHTESGDTTLSASGFLSLRSTAVDKGESIRPMATNQFENAAIPGSSVIVVTCASIVEPFLSQQPYGTSPVEARDFPKLIVGAEIDVLVEVPGGKSSDGEYHSQCWIPAQLERVVDIPAAGAALQGLLDVHGGSVDGAWEVGWALAPLEGNSRLQGLSSGAPTARAIVKDEPSRRWAVEEPAFSSPATNGVKVGSLSMAATRVAILSLSLKGGNDAASVQDSLCEQASYIGTPSEVPFDLAANSLKRGDFLLVVGSPFGALSPLHFHNSLSAGVVSNCWPPTTKPTALLMADIRCLPGMEGGPVFNEQGVLVGMLTRPLRQRGGGAEVQLVMTCAVLAPALQNIGVILGVRSMKRTLLTDGNVDNPTWSGGAISSLEADSCRGMIPPFAGSESRPFISPAIAETLNSVVLVTIGDGAWASGVIISEGGLILTNAHLLEPWRFGKIRSSHLSTLLSKCDGDSAMMVESDKECDDQCCSSGVDFKERDKAFWVKRDQGSLDNENCSTQSLSTARGYQRIRVRLEHLQQRSWHNADAVYVSQGPLDIAVLRLVAPPSGLSPITPEESCPSPGSRAVVIGHGLFGPRAELSPSVSAGVVARVVKAESQGLSRARVTENGGLCRVSPAMLQTTAAVHPGGSGGAVVNSQGRMIGLVTSNARHSGGSVIPFLNFSVPFAALALIFEFASKGGGDLAMLKELDKPDKFLSAVWALVPSSPPRPPVQHLPTPGHRHGYQTSPTLPDPPHDPQTIGPMKGSRFAQFIAENGAEVSFQQPIQSENGQPTSHKLVVGSRLLANSLFNPQFCSRL